MKTKAKEQQLNQTLSECYTEDEAVDRFIYLTNKTRGKATTENHIRQCYREYRLGSLLRRLDPTAFYVD